MELTEEPLLSEAEVSDLLETLHTHFGYDFTSYTVSSVKRRLRRFMSTNRLGSVAELKSKMLSHQNLSAELIRDISVTVTEMFRDPSFYLYLRQVISRRLATYPLIKIWVAGCATGEEAYSLAILLKEEGLLDRCLLYATDINQHSIDAARNGIYPIASMKLYTSNYLASGGKVPFSQYYHAMYGSVLLDASLKERIVFSTHNLVSDSAFNEFQLISCRNVLIYFNPFLQNRVLSLFYESLCSFGFLCLGNKESLLFSDQKRFFEEQNRKERVFMKSENLH